MVKVRHTKSISMQRNVTGGRDETINLPRYFRLGDLVSYKFLLFQLICPFHVDEDHLMISSDRKQALLKINYPKEKSDFRI